MEHAFSPWVVPWQAGVPESEERQERPATDRIDPHACPPPADKAAHKPEEMPEYFLG